MNQTKPNTAPPDWAGIIAARCAVCRGRRYPEPCRNIACVFFQYSPWAVLPPEPEPTPAPEPMNAPPEWRVVCANVCRRCVLGQTNDAKACNDTACPVWPWGLKWDMARCACCGGTCNA